MWKLSELFITLIVVTVLSTCIIQKPTADEPQGLCRFFDKNCSSKSARGLSVQHMSPSAK